MKQWDRFARWIDLKKIAVITIGIYIITMLPLWYLAFFARPSGDDYGYSGATHRIWLATHSLLQVLKTSLETTKSMCMTWNGDWFTVFIFTLMPEAFITYSFWIVPVTMSLLMMISYYCLAKEVLVNRLKLEKYQSAMIVALVLMLSFQFIPSTAIAMYWYVGTIHYILPHIVAMFALTALSKFERTGRIKYIWLSVPAAIMMGGSSYFSVLLVLMIYVLTMLCWGRKNRKLFWTGVPLTAGIAATVIQVIMPGNAARAAEEGSHLTLSGSMIVYTIIRSLVQAVQTTGTYFTDKTFIFLAFIVIAILTWECLNGRQMEFQFPHPIIFTILMYGFFSAMFAPEIYAAVEVSLGPASMQYLTFILTGTATIVYWEGWIQFRRRKDAGMKKDDYHSRIVIPALIVCCLVVFMGRGTLLENSVFKMSTDYIRSGQAADFKRQIHSQMEILLDGSIREAHLCPINDQQGPLMHMPVTGDPGAFTNRVVAKFYGKDSVVMDESWETK